MTLDKCQSVTLFYTEYDSILLQVVLPNIQSANRKVAASHVSEDANYLNKLHDQVELCRRVHLLNQMDDAGMPNPA